MRIAHITDLHFQNPPKVLDLLAPKRILGTVNLYLRGRVNHFDINVQKALVKKCLELEPDFLVCSGDFTAMSTLPEFQKAFETLKPLFESLPSFIIPGNHDIYVKWGVPKAMTDLFGQWMGSESPWLHQYEQTSVLHIETCRPHFLSRGWVNPEDLKKAETLLRYSVSGCP